MAFPRVSGGAGKGWVLQLNVDFQGENEGYVGNGLLWGVLTACPRKGAVHAVRTDKRQGPQWLARDCFGNGV